MSTLVFTTDPSLEPKGSRQQYLLIANARAHASRQAHNARRKTFLSKAKPSPCTHKRRQAKVARHEKVPDHTAETDSRAPPVVTATVDQPLATKYSTYLEETYAEHHPERINTLFDYYLKEIGPVYAWNWVSSEQERKKTEHFHVLSFLNEPAFAEALLAWLQLLRDQAYARTGSLSYITLYHQCKSLNQTRRLLSKPDDKRYHGVLAVTTVLHMILNLEIGDTKSYQINLTGMRQIISLMGGMRALKKSMPRIHMFIKSINQANSHQEKVEQPPSADPTHPVSVPDSPPDRTDDDDNDEEDEPARDFTDAYNRLPEELSILWQKGKLKLAISHLKSAAIVLLCRRDKGLFEQNAKSAPELTDQKILLESEMLKAMKKPGLTDLEFILCAGSLVKLATTTPIGKAREDVVRESVALRLVNRLWKLATEWDEEKRTTILWTCLIVRSLPEDVISDHDTQDSLLRYVVDRVGTDIPWDQVRPQLAKIYLNDEIEAEWRGYWEKMIDKGSIS